MFLRYRISVRRYSSDKSIQTLTEMHTPHFRQYHRIHSPLCCTTLNIVFLPFPFSCDYCLLLHKKRNTRFHPAIPSFTPVPVLIIATDFWKIYILHFPKHAQNVTLTENGLPRSHCRPASVHPHCCRNCRVSSHFSAPSVSLNTIWLSTASPQSIPHCTQSALSFPQANDASSFSITKKSRFPGIFHSKLMTGIEPVTSALPRRRSTD